MSVSLIWILEDPFKKYRKETMSCILEQSKGLSEPLQLLCYGADQSRQKEITEAIKEAGAKVQAEFYTMPEGSFFEEAGQRHTIRPDLVYADAAENVSSQWVSMLYDGDSLSAGMLSEVERHAKEHPEIRVQFSKKQPLICFCLSRDPDTVAGSMAKNAVKARATSVTKVFDYPIVNTTILTEPAKRPELFPFILGGTFLKKECFTGKALQNGAGWDSELKFFLELCRGETQLLFLGDQEYKSRVAYDGDIVFYRRLYQEEFYLDSLQKFWIPYLKQLKEAGPIPEFIQYYAVFSLRNRFSGNRNNKNKHVIEGREDAFFALVTEELKLLEDRVILNEKQVGDCRIGKDLQWLFGLMKHGPSYHFTIQGDEKEGFFGDGGVRIDPVAELRCEIQTMDPNGGGLEIDGRIDNVLFSMAERIFLRYGDKEYEPVYNERYALKKYFGISLMKDHCFHLTIPTLMPQKTELFCIAVIGGREYEIEFGYASHFSRMSPNFKNSYWAFRSGSKFLMRKKRGGLVIQKAMQPRIMWQEFLLFLNMLFVQDRRAKIFILIRAAFFVTRPFLKRRPIWLYLDKIYKGGDSAEYLYRYASGQKDGFSHYYLIDQKTPDYKRLVADGYKPLVRGTILHRLIFLMADMVVISNSTVFSFNSFGQINSSYIRDLPNFHCCCVQHGMSVQKIAVAQNRLRDKTELYFCASKYEFDNLLRPVYDYEGYDILKLTGVPRYDGLKNRDQKQILISPTWRMQSAVPVRGSEGYQRDYNPLFKESAYFKVYNSLINDERLIAAAKEYGYRIKYVLHPIVSAQGKDFQKNDYVDIIPSVGDMSYEKLFCESSLMVTDFSGVQFDFAYMRKPVVYLHHSSIPEHYEEGSFFYDTMGFGEICRDNDSLVDLLIEYMKNGCQMKDVYRQRADDFFYYNDDHNCERIYQEMLSFQKKVGITT
ncbi:MAG: CDP-glycerol glycerophosphotransferase family protein [Lachnospiraceae bacterium]|nr:CDP-glycerol glycerophosphotransferase family protein [Lachnospiraceae bacterium]